MAQETIAAGGTLTIPDRRFNGMNGPRKSLIIHLVSGDAYYGFNSDVDDSGATTAGIPMSAGQSIYFSDNNGQFTPPLYIYSSAGGVINYQEDLQP